VIGRMIQSPPTQPTGSDQTTVETGHETKSTGQLSLTAHTN